MSRTIPQGHSAADCAAALGVWRRSSGPRHRDLPHAKRLRPPPAAASGDKWLEIRVSPGSDNRWIRNKSRSRRARAEHRGDSERVMRRRSRLSGYSRMSSPATDQRR